MNVLIVDDVYANLRLLRAILEAEGHRVLDAQDGVEALKVIDAEPLDAVISDILMPNMDGFRLCQELRHGERQPLLPFILYSSTYTEPADRALGLRLGADKFIPKSAPAGQLLAALAEVTGPEWRSPASALHPPPGTEVMRQYSSRLVKKLEDRTLDLERESQRLALANAALRDEIVRRERAEEGNRRMAELVESSNDAIISESLDAIVTSWNPAAEKIYGYTAEEMIGRSSAVLVPPDCGSEDSDVLARASLERRRFHLETRRLRKDGTQIDVALTVSPIRSADGAVSGVSKIARDITQRRRAERELAGLQVELVKSSRQAGIAEVATSVLHNVGNVLNSVNVASSCLRDSITRSKAGNLVKVVALMSEHKADIGAFLASDAKGHQIPEYLAQLAEHLVTEHTRALKELGQLQENIQHIKDAVTLQQDLARRSSVAQTVRVETLVEDALRMNAGNLDRRDIQIRREFAVLPAVVVDRGQVLQILVNLLRNAQQACDQGDASSQKVVTVRTAAAPGGFRIVVADNGCGIAAENLPLIFSVGFTTKADGHGFGLHSAIVAAGQMGGSLSVHSDGPGRGASFTLELPLADARSPRTSE